MYNFLLHSVQYCVTQCTMLCYIMYNAVLHCVKWIITHCTMLHYTLYNRVKHMQCQINVLYYPVYKYILCAILYIHNVYKAVLNVVHFRVTLCTMLSYKDHYILLHSVQFFIIHNTMLYYTLYNAGYIMLRFKVMNIFSFSVQQFIIHRYLILWTVFCKIRGGGVKTKLTAWQTASTQLIEFYNTSVLIVSVLQVFFRGLIFYHRGVFFVT